MQLAAFMRILQIQRTFDLGRTGQGSRPDLHRDRAEGRCPGRHAGSTACRRQFIVARNGSAEATPGNARSGCDGLYWSGAVRQSKARDMPVRVLVRNRDSAPELQGGNIEIMTGDLTRDADLLQGLDGMRVVYHLARSHVTSWEDYKEHEIEVVRRIVQACLAAKVTRFIYTGTIDSYYAGASAGTITEETPLDPHIGWRNYYACAKALSEHVLMSMFREQRLPIIIFRPGIVIGHGGSPLYWGVGMWSWTLFARFGARDAIRCL